MAQFEIMWTAPEFEYREKGVSWYWISIIVAACIIAFAIWERNFLFGFFIVVAEVLVILWGNEQPREVMFALNDGGLSIGPDGSEGSAAGSAREKFHSLKEFESWSTDELGDGMSELGFNFTAKFKVPLKVLAPTETVDDIRKNLKPLLREVEHQMTFIEAIEKLIRF